MTAQVADVRTTLGSVCQIVKAGNCVHFESGNCYIENRHTGKRIWMEEKNGTYEVGLWVPKHSAVERVVIALQPASCHSEPLRTFARPDDQF